MNSSLISIIVPVYKVEKYLDECIQSLVNQTYSNIEIILVDDGSPDRCPQMCDEWGQRDSRIRVIHKTNGGLSSARNAGLDVARGDYISFIDSDDYVDISMFEKLYKGILSSSNIGVCSIKFLKLSGDHIEPYNKIWDNKNEVLVKSVDFGRLTLLQKVCHASTNKLYRADLLKDVRFRVGKTNEDTLFMYDLSKIICLNNVDMLELPYYTYYYRMHEGSICNTISSPIEIAYISNLEQIYNESDTDELRNAAKYMINRATFFFCVLLAQGYYGNLYDCYFACYRSKLKNVTSSQIRDTEYDSVSLILIFWMIKNAPCLYKIIYMIKRFLF